MSVFRRGKKGESLEGKIWWYEFHFRGQRIRASTGSRSKSLAIRAERQRRYELEAGANNLKSEWRPALFSVSAKEYLQNNSPHWSSSNLRIETYNAGHLKEFFGNVLLSDISAQDISQYQEQRLKAGASRRTCNLECGTLRAILRKARLWANLQPDVKMLKVSDAVGQSLSPEQEEKLLLECARSRSRSLYPVVALALSTGLRYGEIRFLTWRQIDFGRRALTVGHSKTEAGTGRVVPLNDRAIQIIKTWEVNFPQHQPAHFVFAAEEYGVDGAGKVCVHSTDPSRPMGTWNEGWEAAKKRAGIVCRFHDLRHTACTRMLESGSPISVVGALLGWSASTAIRMSKRYGHIGQAAQIEAVRALNGSVFAVPSELPTPPIRIQ